MITPIKYFLFLVFANDLWRNKYFLLGVPAISAFVPPTSTISTAATSSLAFGQPRSILLFCHGNNNDADATSISNHGDSRLQEPIKHTQKYHTTASTIKSTRSPLQQQQQQQERRKFIKSTATGAVGLLIPFTHFIATSSASNVPTIMQEQTGKVDGFTTRPICIIGANGKTGSECVGACLARGIPVVATTRGGVYTGKYANAQGSAGVKGDLVDNVICDVTLPDTINAAIKGSRAVIFAASASKAGGTPVAVDNVGLVNLAKACIDEQIPHLVIVSSGAVTKPDSPVFKFLNLFGNIMEEKIKGEDNVRDMYQKYATGTGATTSCTYTIIRPGGLTEESAKGVQALELNQGDTKSGRIARADVASLCIEATKYPSITGGTTFECYDADTGKPLQTVGISNLFKQRNSGSNTSAGSSEVYMSGYEQRGSTWEELFTGLKKDASEF
mmetsp:Transcript_3658/g.6920  ORF Transcript_3658/g.6920 Transcript_3658/m.6920 type:complete len:445 (-) Transcript_3658:165-1499(-)